jgi:two-component system, LuxR family, secretion system response regulator SsrB
MKSLIEWEEDWLAMFQLHSAHPTPNMLEEWESEKKYILNLHSHPDVSTTFVDIREPRFELHIEVHKKWLEHEAVRMSEPCNFKYLTDLTHKDDRIFSLETELMGYEIMMTLQPHELAKFWFKYQRRLRDKNGIYIFYSLYIEIYKLDENDCPWLLKIVTQRLPETYQPEEIHYRAFSHQQKKGKITATDPIKLSRREKEILILANEGFKSKEIAIKLHISYETVKNTRKRYLKKLNADTTSMAYTVAQKRKMI